MANEVYFKDMQEDLNKRFLEVAAKIIDLKLARNEKDFWNSLGVIAYTQKKYKISKNMHHVSSDLLIRINRIYGVSVDYLIGAGNDMFCKKMKGKKSKEMV